MLSVQLDLCCAFAVEKPCVNNYIYTSLYSVETCEHCIFAVEEACKTFGSSDLLVFVLASTTTDPCSVLYSVIEFLQLGSAECCQCISAVVLHVCCGNLLVQQ